MELRQLIYFEAVARCGGFSAAAQHLHIAQPAVSAQIKRLETELGTALLERTTRHVALTAAGELFLARTRTVLNQIDAAHADLADLAAVLRGHLRIGATQVLGSLDLPRSLAQFHRRYPAVTLTLRTGLIAELLRDLDAGTIDVAVGPVHADLRGSYLSRPLVSERLVLITPPGQRVPTTGTTLITVRDEPFVCLPSGSGLHTILTTAAAAAGFTPRVAFQTHSAASIRELVAAGLGVALLAESAARTSGPTITVHDLDPAPQHPPIGMIHTRGRALAPAACRRAPLSHLRQRR